MNHLANTDKSRRARTEESISSSYAKKGIVHAPDPDRQYDDDITQAPNSQDAYEQLAQPKRE